VILSFCPPPVMCAVAFTYPRKLVKIPSAWSFPNKISVYGTIVFAKRNEDPEVRKDNYYTIEGIVESEMGACAKHLRVVLAGCEGDYSRKTFRVNDECIKRMDEDSN